ncbi:hypothetical protein FRC18_012216 [Serendipita sp. 400]|nr:hypothetical protein FRC18_012216 [Serendipita sp. 400]
MERLQRAVEISKNPPNFADPPPRNFWSIFFTLFLSSTFSPYRESLWGTLELSSAQPLSSKAIGRASRNFRNNNNNHLSQNEQWSRSPNATARCHRSRNHSSRSRPCAGKYRAGGQWQSRSLGHDPGSRPD